MSNHLCTYELRIPRDEVLNSAAIAAWEVITARALKAWRRSVCIIIETTAATRVGVLKRSTQPPNL